MGNGAEIDNGQWDTFPIPQTDKEKEEGKIKTKILNYGGVPAANIEQTAQKLGISAESVQRRIDGDVLLSFKLEEDGETLIPDWQFNGPRPQVLPDIIFLSKMFPEDPWGTASILTSPQPSLDGKTPVEVFKSGDLDARLKARRTMTALIKDLYGLD